MAARYRAGRAWASDVAATAGAASLRRRGVVPKLAQDLARHSTITLTMDHYSHTVHAERVAATEALPDLDAKPDAASRAA